jgi:hypothetical protein
MIDYTNRNVIGLQISASSPYLEGEVVATDILPGMLCQEHHVTPTSAPGLTLAGFDNWDSERIFAQENLYHGRTIHDPFLIGERAHTRICRAGDVVLAWWGDTGYPSFGDFLGSKGNGTLRGIAVFGNPVLAISLEEWTEAPATLPARLRIRVL